MKKLAFFAVVLGGIALASCSKEKECHCVYIISGSFHSETYYTIKEGECEDLNSSTSVMENTNTLTCEEEPKYNI
tara:strand:- start:1444 stop:1668 length:225 start_codon:yes stop_codon:yes gene_type:complete